MQRSTIAVWIAFASLALTCCSGAAVPDRYPEVKNAGTRHRFDLQLKKLESGDNEVVPDLQVGCGDGLLVERTTAAPKHTLAKEKLIDDVDRKHRTKREEDAAERKSRSYYGYTIYTPAFVSYSSVFRPQPYKFERPYYIPIFGQKGRMPIYFPPQPVYRNPAFPLDNPPPSKGYLPPSTPTTTSEVPQPALVDTEDRFGPVWDTMPVQPASTTQAPTLPTRRPNRPKASTFPPLVHALAPSEKSGADSPPPPPSVVEENEVQSTPVLPTPSAQVRPSTSRPNRCAFAIINCCSGGSKNVSSTCFERLGCPGPFWDRSPCESDFAKEAVKYALNYYV